MKLDCIDRTVMKKKPAESGFLKNVLNEVVGIDHLLSAKRWSKNFIIAAEKSRITNSLIMFWL